MTERDVHTYLISKGNCGVPYFAGTEAVYTGTPELMAQVHAAGRQGRRTDRRWLLRHVAGAPRGDAPVARRTDRQADARRHHRGGRSAGQFCAVRAMRPIASVVADGAASNLRTG